MVYILGLCKVVVESAVSGRAKRLEMIEAACFGDSKMTAR